MPQVFIISNSADMHTDLLVDACTRQDVQCFRYNTDHFRAGGAIDWNIDNAGQFRIGDREVEISDISLLIYRRPKPYFGKRNDVDKWLGWLYDQEWSSIEVSLTEYVDCPVVNHPRSSYYAQHKTAQLKAAKKNHIKHPKTLITNSKPALEEFLSEQPCVSKAIFDCSSTFQGTVHTGKTVSVTLDDIKSYDTTFCPLMLQEKINCSAMWRIVVIGQSVYGFRLHGDKLTTETDSRLIELELHGDIADVPSSIAHGLIAMCRDLGLTYASSDFIEDMAGQLWFIDLNPEGQWGAYEKRFGVNISDEIIKLNNASLK